LTGAGGEVPSSELREHGCELDRGFGQAVARPLAGSRVLTGEQFQLDESLESVGENIEAIPSSEPACSSRK
jgi:hypothetical protein